MIPAFRRTVLSYGRFDSFGLHHSAFLQHAMTLGDELIIGCATDRYSLARGLPCAQPFELRKAMLEHCRYVDRVIILQDFAQIRTDIVNYNASVLVVSQDDPAAFDTLHDIVQIQYLPTATERQPPLLQAV